jgi:hypothetical protein
MAVGFSVRGKTFASTRKVIFLGAVENPASRENGGDWRTTNNRIAAPSERRNSRKYIKPTRFVFHGPPNQPLRSVVNTSQTDGLSESPTKPYSGRRFTEEEGKEKEEIGRGRALRTTNGESYLRLVVTDEFACRTKEKTWLSFAGASRKAYALVAGSLAPSLVPAKSRC